MQAYLRISDEMIHAFMVQSASFFARNALEEHLKSTKIKGITAMGDHKQGEMDITVQKKTFDGFIKVTVWSTVIVILALIFLALVGI